MLLRLLGQLATRGVERATVVLGHGGERIRSIVGERVGPLEIGYAWNHDYARTEHGWSLYCARASWRAAPGDVVLVDADNVLSPALIDRLLAQPAPDCVVVDPGAVREDRDEELVLGHAGTVTGFVRGRPGGHPACVGAFVGLNRFSATYVQALFDLLEALGDDERRGLKYERVLDRLIRTRGLAPAWLDCAGLPWVNVNHPDDLARAEAVGRSAASPEAARASARA